MGWTLFFMFVVLKIPIALLGWLIWYAIKQDPAADEQDDGGGEVRRRPHPRPPRRPRPRRGPHGDPAPLAPPRVRSVIARARELER